MMAICTYVKYGLLFAGMILCAYPAKAAPERIVSLDYCADAYLLALADKDQIRALSPDVDAPYAWTKNRGLGLPHHQGSAEEILTLKPDLVVHSGLGHLKSLAMLRRFHVDEVDIGYSESLAHAKKAVSQVAAALGQTERGKHLLADMDERIKRLKKRREMLDQTGRRPTALYMTPSGISAGPGTYLHEMMALAGIDNHLAGSAVRGFSSISLEDLVRRPPEMVITSFFQTRTGWQAAWRFSQHPSSRRIMEEAAHVTVPAEEWGCGGFFMIEAAETLIKARAGWQRDANRVAQVQP